MITLTTQQDRFFKQGFKVKYQLLLKDHLGTWRNLSNLVNQDWVYSITINSDIDNLLNTADIELIRGAGNLCISPLNTVSLLNKLSGSYVPLVNLNREIKVNVQYVPDLSASVSSYLTIFHGYIDSFSIEPDNSLRISCRDLGAFLQDRFIEEERVYPHTSATPPQEYESELVHVVMQQILNDNLGAGTIVLYTPVNPGWMIKKYRQSKVNLLDALNALASQIGYSVRYKYDSTASVWKLTFYCPDRDKTTSDYTFDGNHILNVSNVSLDIAGIRNVIRIYYGPVDEEQPEKRQYVQKTDTDSIALYGRKYMEIAEGSTSHIDEYAEAENLANIALKDLKDPKANIQVEIPFFPFVELGDLYTFKGNNDFFTDDLNLAVVSYSHNLSAGNISTSLTCRGKPAGAYIRWHQQNAVWHGTHRDSAPEPPTIVAVEPQVLGFLVTLSNPTSVDWDGYEVYMSRIDGFTPSSLNQVARGRNTKFNIPTLNTNATYYFKALAYDKYGNKSDYSPQVSNTPSRVSVEGISDDYIGRSFYTSFEDDTNDDGIPDGFSFSVVPNSTIQLIDTDSFYGKYCIKMVANSGTSASLILNKYIATSYLDKPLVVTFFTKRPAKHNNSQIYLDIEEYNSSKNLIGTSSVSLIEASQTEAYDWVDNIFMLNMRDRFNTNTKYIKLAIRYFSTIDFDSGIYIDDLRIEPLKITTASFPVFSPQSIFQVSSVPRNIWKATELVYVEKPGNSWVTLKNYDTTDMEYKEYNNLTCKIVYTGGPSSMYMDIRFNILRPVFKGRYIDLLGMYTPEQHLLFTRDVWQDISYTFDPPIRVIFLQGIQAQVRVSSPCSSVQIMHFYLNGNSWNFVV